MPWVLYLLHAMGSLTFLIMHATGPDFLNVAAITYETSIIKTLIIRTLDDQNTLPWSLLICIG